MNKFYFFLLLIFIFSSCKVKYASKDFDAKLTPVAPTYSNAKDWAVLPDKIPTQLKSFINSDQQNYKADVFFVYPTILTDRKDDSWNADVYDSIFNEKILNKSIHYQASAWVNTARLFVPYYRQSHLRIYFEPYKNQGKFSSEIAYQDVKKAFEYYLKNYNNGKPIIIASHSQGSILCKRLLKEYFDGKPLQNQLIAAYVPGTSIKPNEFKVLKPMTKPDETGGYVVWNSYKWKKLPKRYQTFFKGSVTSNPISWNHQKTTTLEEHKGMLYKNNQIYPESIKVEVNDGILWVDINKVPKKLLLRFTYNYHFADINLFWEDIRQNTLLRIDAFFNNK